MLDHSLCSLLVLIKAGSSLLDCSDSPIRFLLVFENCEVLALNIPRTKGEAGDLLKESSSNVLPKVSGKRK